MKWVVYYIGLFILQTSTSAQELDSVIHAFDYGEHTKVEYLLKPMLEKQPISFQAHTLWARNLLAIGKTDNAIAYLDSLISTHKDISLLYHWKGEALLKKLDQIDGFFESGKTLLKARDALFTAVKLDKNNLEARLTLAGYYFEAPGIIGGSNHKANKEVEYVRQLDPIKAGLFLSDYHIQKNRLEEAEEELNSLARLSQADGEVYFALGRLYQRKKEYNKAFDAFLLGINKGHHACYYQYARTAIFAKENIPHGISYLLIYLKRKPKKEQPGWSYAHWRLGILYEMNGKDEEALAHYQISIKMNPDVLVVKDSYRQLKNKLNIK